MKGSPGPPRRAVLCDLGNSRWKLTLGVWQGPGSFVLRALGRDRVEAGDGFASLRALFASHALAGSPVAVSSVASEESGEALRAAFLELKAASVLWHPHHGLELCVRNEHTVGLDRLYAARRAFALVRGQSVVVIDAGTAVTVDAVAPAGTNGRGAFLGGAIAPGPELLAKALASGGAQLWSIEPRPGVPALGKETSEALAAGVVVGLEGAVLNLVRRVAAEAGFDAPKVVLTGGAAPFVAPVLKAAYPGLIEDPDLVLGGLAMAFEESCHVR